MKLLNAKLKKYKSSGSDQIQALLIQAEGVFILNTRQMPQHTVAVCLGTDISVSPLYPTDPLM
jgi:hypothetical protein